MSPLFVTWNLVSSSGGKKLRGCIGTFEPLPLTQGLRSYSLTAYFLSQKLSIWRIVHLMIRASIRLPVKKFPNSNAGNLAPTFNLSWHSVSLLINFETCADPLDWTRGVHGIRIAFPHPQSPSRRRLSATYLPDVCTEQGWTKDECLESLMRKAGYDPSYSSRGTNGGLMGWRGVQGLKVERYRALKGRISYDGYVDAIAELAKLNWKHKGAQGNVDQGMIEIV